jgi:ethanolamine utilization protein EutQ (cupin superfamily)
MVQLLSTPARIPVPGGKIIDEHVGRVATHEERVSVAHMRAPAQWEEPAQTPDFEEITLVLAGTLYVDHDGGQLAVSAGQAVVARAGERVRYHTGLDGADYVSVCLPAFAARLVHREES